MSHPTESTPEHVLLPSGRSVEVVYHAAPAVPGGADLHLCGSCGSQMIHPVAWERLGESAWQAELRCPECEWRGTGVFTDDEAAAFDEELERGTQQVLADLRALSHANFEADVEAFCRALQFDLIVPDDF